MERTLSGPILRVDVVRIDDAAVVRLDGELDFGTAPLVEDALRQAEEAERLRRVVVDASQLTFVDASGLDPLVAASERLGPGCMRIRSPQPPVRRVLELLSLTELFELDARG